MSSKAYRATRVNEVNWEPIARGKEGLGVTVGVNVGKFDLLVICRSADGRFERPWRVRNPWGERNRDAARGAEPGRRGAEPERNRDAARGAEPGRS